MNDNRGFLLLEVMVSVVIVTSGLLYVTRVYSTANQIVKRSQAMFESGLLIEDRMFGYEERGEIPEDESKEGGFPELKDRNDIFWKIKSAHLPKELNLDINVVDVEIYGKKGPETKGTRRVTTYLKNSKKR